MCVCVCVCVCVSAGGGEVGGGGTACLSGCLLTCLLVGRIASKYKVAYTCGVGGGGGGGGREGRKTTIFNSLCHSGIKLKTNCLHSHRIKSCDTERLLDPLTKDDSANNQNSPAACPGMFQHTSAASKQATETLYSGVV